MITGASKFLSEFRITPSLVQARRKGGSMRPAIFSYFFNNQAAFVKGRQGWAA